MLAVLPGLMLAMLLGALDQTIMAPALPYVAGDLGGLDQMPAVVTAYLVAATAVMPLYGKLGDRFGRKPVMQAAIVVFVAGAICCGLAQSLPQLIAFRALQGAGGGGLIIGSQAIIGEIVSPRERGRYLALIGMAYVVAAVAGPLVGGFFVDQLSWRWIFAIYPPLGLLAFVGVTLTLRLPSPEERAPIDYAGAILLSAAVVGIVLLTTPTSVLPVWLLATLTAAALAGWLIAARLATDPIVPLHLFRDRAFAIPCAISFLIGFALFGTISYLPAFLQIALGASATQAGLLITSLMAGVLLSISVSGRLISRTGAYKPYPIAGTALATTGFVLLTTVDGSSPAAIVAGITLLIGLGVGLVMQVMVLAAQNSVDHAHLGAATSTVTFLRQIGSAVGVALVGALITTRFADLAPQNSGVGGDAGALSPAKIAELSPGAQAAVSDAFGAAVPPVFGYLAPLLGIAFLLAVALPARPLRTTSYLETARSVQT